MGKKSFNKNYFVNILFFLTGFSLSTIFIWPGIIKVENRNCFINILKDLFAQPRPCYSYIQNFPMIAQCGPELTGLPSNHALNFFMFSTLVHLFLKNRFVSTIFFGFSFLVSFSRVLLVKHWFSQVIIGGLIGIVLAKIFYEAYMKWKKS